METWRERRGEGERGCEGVGEGLGTVWAVARLTGYGE